jgi:Zn-dependent protease
LNILSGNPLGFLLDILYRIPGVILAFTVHEFMHAFVAVRMGDPTPREQGRLTLNPGAHLDVVGLIMLLVFGFGWAKPVQVRPSNFKHPKLGDVLVSLSGPLSNLVLGVLLFPIAMHMTVESIQPYVASAYSINILLFCLNILPVPPLDGFHIVKSLFGLRRLKFFWNIERYGFVLLILLSFTGALGFVLSAGYSAVTMALSQVFS